jgi:hypothetical protein
VRKASLAHQAHGQDSPSNSNLAAVSLQIGSGGLVKLAGQLGNRVGPAKFVWIRFQAQRLNLLQFLLTLLKLLARLKLQKENPFRYCREYSGQRSHGARNASQVEVIRLSSRIGSSRCRTETGSNLILAL